MSFDTTSGASAPGSSNTPTSSGATPGGGGANPSSQHRSLTDRISGMRESTPQVDAQSQQKVPEQKANEMGSQKPDEAVNPVVATEPDTKSAKVVEIEGRKIDVSNPEALAKKMVDFEKGMRKFQVERDQLKAQVQQLSGEKLGDEDKASLATFKKLLGGFTTASEKGMSAAGVDYVMNEMFSAETLNTWLQKKLQHHSHLLNLDPAQKEAYLAQYRDREAFDQEKLRVALERQEIDQFRTERTTLEQRTTQAELTSVLTPSWRENAFKLPSKRMNDALNKELWNSAKEEIKTMISNGQELTSEAVAQVFAGIRADIESGMNLDSKQKVAKAVDEKKQEAMTGLSQAVNQGQAPGSVDDMIKQKASWSDVFRTRMANASRG